MTAFLPKIKILLILVKNSRKSEINFFPVVRYFTWKLELATHILWMIVDITFCFAYGESDKVVKFQNIMTQIAWKFPFGSLHFH